MPFLLLIIFLAYPLLEITLLIRLGGAIGAWGVLAFIVGTAVIGTIALRRHGLLVMRRAAEAMREGRPPVEPVIEGALMGLGGGLLIVPGVLSDFAGGLLLVAPVRRWLVRLMMRPGSGGPTHTRRATGDPFSRARTGSRHSGATHGPSGARPQAANDDEETGEPKPRQKNSDPIVIDGEFTRLDERPIDGEPPRKDPR